MTGKRGEKIEATLLAAILYFSRPIFLRAPLAGC
jgi:hypothetical protein